MRIIGHLDMDAFFASVEERDHEWLRGKPVIVGADPKGGEGRGVVSTANYKAREYGIRSALPISRAWALCNEAKKEGKPECFFLGGNFSKYSKVSAEVMKIISKYCPKLEQASVDEAYFELSVDSWGEAREIARRIKKEILEKEELTCSIGIGPNKLVAKIASDFKKPDGLTLVREKDVEKFLEPMTIRKIPGIGPKTEAMFLKRGIKTVLDLKKLSREEIPHLYDRIRGEGDSLIVQSREAKSISEENTFEADTLDSNILLGCLKSLAGYVFRRFKKDFKSFKTVSIKIRFENFETKTRAKTLESPSRDLSTLERETMKLFLPFLDARENPRKRKIRLIGVKIEKFA